MGWRLIQTIQRKLQILPPFRYNQDSYRLTPNTDDLGKAVFLTLQFLHIARIFCTWRIRKRAHFISKLHGPPDQPRVFLFPSDEDSIDAIMGNFIVNKAKVKENSVVLMQSQAPYVSSLRYSRLYSRPKFPASCEGFKRRYNKMLAQKGGIKGTVRAKNVFFPRLVSGGIQSTLYMRGN